MGINKSALRLMLLAKKEKADFSKMLTLGRLRYYADKDLSPYKHIIKSSDSHYTNDYSDELYTQFGAESIDCMDFSDYEKASILHDLNTPFPEELKSKFSVLIDSGTLEHVFSFTTGMKSCMEALKVGGHFLGITPANNMMGHGFYQLSPELYYRIFSKENGFRVKHLFLVPADEVDVDSAPWYSVPDPKEVRSRIMLCNNKPMYMLVIAEKIEDKEVFQNFPQQSDYETTWEVHKSVKNNVRSESTGVLKHLYRKHIPQKAKNVLRKIHSDISTGKAENADLGVVNSEHFVSFDIDKYLHAK